MLKIAGPVTNGTWVIGNMTPTRQGVMVANAVVSLSNSEVPVRILNPCDQAMVLKELRNTDCKHGILGAGPSHKHLYCDEEC